MKSPNLILLLLGLIMIGIVSFNFLNNNDSEIKADEQKSTCKEDSLNFIILELTIEKGRYEIIIDRIRQVDSAIVDAASMNLE
jgi:hypothetical protein